MAYAFEILKAIHSGTLPTDVREDFFQGPGVSPVQRHVGGCPRPALAVSSPREVAELARHPDPSTEKGGRCP